MLSGRRELLVGNANPLRALEAEDPELLDIPAVSVDVVLTSKAHAGRSLEELGRESAARGVCLRRLMRAGQELPVTPKTVVERGDVLTLSGARSHVEAIANRIGFAE